MNPEFKKRLEGLTVPLVEFGREAFGLSSDASYEAARRGDIPTLTINGRYFVPCSKARRMLALSEPHGTERQIEAA